MALHGYRPGYWYHQARWKSVSGEGPWITVILNYDGGDELVLKINVEGAREGEMRTSPKLQDAISEARDRAERRCRRDGVTARLQITVAYHETETSMDTADMEQIHQDRDSRGESEMSDADRETDLRSWNRPGEIQKHHRAANPVEGGPEASSRQLTPRGRRTGEKSSKGKRQELEEEWSSSDPLASWTALAKASKGEMFVGKVVIDDRKAGAYYDTCSTRNFISRACIERLRLQGQVQCLSRHVELTCANKQRMVVNDYLQDVECCFPYEGGELRHRVSFLVSDDLPMNILLSMYYLSIAQPQFDWDRKVVKHILPGGGTAKLRKFKASSLMESYGCMCAAAFYNYYKQNLEEGMYLVYVSAAGEPVKMPSEIEGVVAKYPNLFEEPTEVVEREVVHTIEIIPRSSIPKGRIYRTSPSGLDELRRQLKELVEKGWIRLSVSPYGSPVLFVSKKGGTLRMCIDYRGLNAITVKNREPLPRIDDLLDRVQGCRYFSKIDLKSGYHQIAIRPEDQHKTAFQTRYGLYEFVVIPFGLRNAPGTFQHAVNRIFHGHWDKFVIVYLDDILIFSRTVEEHVAHLDNVLSLLRQHKFKINGEKCKFGRTQILYLGHEISAEGLKPMTRRWPAFVTGLVLSL
ncbi:hypothetical protein CBR_g579 [Chara braunii]|uniref:Reverse transcriptase domain-containing protein n=1 Tax=Chara braunii TaxID=69332 RepID=A0A388KBK6_CHABU|nr:hypothetical protein CBR_g579 [Chara braunii]|eukprot:GBG67444.1 hypothetical protein CBR_g579 [Chara braunii]